MTIDFSYEPSEDLLKAVELYIKTNPEITAEDILLTEKKNGNLLLLPTVKNALLEIRKKDVLINPEIFWIIVNKELSKFIEGEQKAKLVLFLCINGRLVENPNELCSYNVLINSESGAGKDWIARNIVQFLPKEQYEYRTRISKKAFTYWHNSRLEPDWSWNNKVCFLEDISNDILNDDTFKVMSSSGSFATIVVDNKAQTIEIKGKPIIILTSASASPNHELLRRFIILTLDESTNQTKAIMLRKAKYATIGKSEELTYDPAIIEAQKSLQRVKVKVPFAELLVEYFPDEHIIMRTHFSRFIDLIKASCAFHQFQREQDSDGYYIATEQDYEIARQAIEAVTSNRLMLPLTKNQLRLWSIILEMDSPFSLDDVIPKVNFCADRTLRRYLDKFAEFSFLRKDLIHTPEANKPKLLFYRSPLGSLSLPSYSDIMTNRHLDNYDKLDK